MYVERQKKKSGTYFYIVENIRRRNGRSKNVRSRGGWEKIRIYIGKDLNSRDLKRLIRYKKSELVKKADKSRKSSDPLFNLISADHQKKISGIKKFYQKNKSKLSKDVYRNYYESFVTEFTYDTNAIEGSTVTLQETALILFDKIVPEGRSVREINEVQNHKDAFDCMLIHKGDINKNFVLKLHKLLMHNILWKYAGRFRDVQVYVRGAGFMPPKPEEVEKQFKHMMLWYRSNKKKYHPVVVAAYFHHIFESVHPFRDGNGRVGRLLLNFILRKNGLPMVNIKYRERSKYYEALEEGNKGDIKPMVSLIIKYLEETEDTAM
ncbi:MAG: Fic family protein [Candidatus Aenigmarchaeota archaeon]|nr:Fic family protein [Candidatus Aenigmarchaeota archaeon]